MINRATQRFTLGFASPQAAIGQPIGISLEGGPNPTVVEYAIIDVAPDVASSVLTSAGELVYHAGAPEGGMLAVATSPEALPGICHGPDRLLQKTGDGRRASVCCMLNASIIDAGPRRMTLIAIFAIPKQLTSPDGRRWRIR